MKPLKLTSQCLVLAFAILFDGLGMCCTKTAAAVIYESESSLGAELHVPMYRWSDPNTAPRMVVLALHGFMLHGGKFDPLARHLAAGGAIVFAPDLRGFGRWYAVREKWPGGHRVNYKQSQRDVSNLLRQLRSTYPNLPIVCVGESMGANLSVSIAAGHPELVDGLVLSSPCIVKRRTLMHLRIIGDAVMGVLCPWYQVDLIPYAQKYVSEDSLKDPLVRKQAGAWEVLHTLRGLHTSLDKASLVKSKIQVLVLRGSNDRLCKFDAVAHLTNRLGSSCKVLHCSADQGHLLLEDPDNVTASESLIDDWLSGKLCQDRESGGNVVEQIDNKSR